MNPPFHKLSRLTMEKLSEAQAILIDCLKFLKISEDGILIILMLIPSDKQISEMADFLLNHRGATEDEIIEKALEISE